MFPYSPDITLGSMPSEKIIRRSVARDNEFFIGRGGNADVYGIDCYPHYVVRVPRAVGVSEASFGPLEMIDDARFEGRNFGQAVAAFANGITIHKKQAGDPVGVPVYFRKGRDNPDVQARNDALYEESTRLVAAIPQEAYCQLIRDIEFLNGIGKRIDPSKSNNLLYVKGSAFNFVDIADDGKRQNRNCPAEAVVILYDNSYAYLYEGPKEAELKANRKLILGKLLNAAERLSVPFVREGAENLGKYPSLRYSLQVAGYEEGTAERLKIEERILCVGQGGPKRAAKVANAAASGAKIAP